MSSPYINTELSAYVSLHPNQMDNKLYLNLKKNLERKVLNKCFKDKGYIMNIYKIDEYRDGMIEAENSSGSAVFDVNFSCRLCIPHKNKQLICKIEKVTKLLLTAVNGPILIIITNQRINNNVFYTDNNNNLRHKKNDTSDILKPGEFVKITIHSTTFNNGDDKIKAIGYLDDIANDDDVKSFYSDIYNS